MKVKAIMIVMSMVVMTAGQTALADGMIVPVRPNLPVRGHWSVKYHHVKVTVRDQVASVHIDQEFVNDSKGDIEVEYLFPVPPGAAMKSMTMIVDGKEMTGKLMEAKKARQIYEDIVRRKKDPALLEYVGFGLYRTRAFPLQKGKPCKVIVTYETVCKKDHNLVEVFYPLNTEKFSSRKIDDVRVTVDIKARADITAVYSPTHDLETKRKGPRHMIATWHVKNAIPDTDFLVYYKAADEDVGATLITYKGDGKKDGYFMMLVSPNPRTAKQKIVPKDVVIVFDHSGSMSGKKIDQAKDALRFVLKNLNDEDRFNVIAYSDSVEPFFKNLAEVTKKNRDEAMDRLDRIEAGGSTDIYGALQTAMKSWPAVDGKPDPRPKYIIFLTDGLPTSGKKTDEKSILADTKKANGAGARIFAFGVGYDVNVRLLDKLVGDNHGRSDYVKPAENIEAKVSSLYSKIKNPVMTNLKMRIQNLKIRDTYPRELGDLFDGDQIIAVGRYDAKDMAKLVAAAGKKNTACTLVVTGVYEGKNRGFEYSVPIRGGNDKRFVFVERLWAVRRVGYLLDQIQLHGENKEIVDELIKLSKTYGIMTPYTAFLADESVALGDKKELSSQGRREARKLMRATEGFRGHAGADTRMRLKQSMRAPVAAVPTPRPGKGAGVKQFGHARRLDYESDKAEYVSGVQNVGNKALYRRGNVWLAPGTESLDLKKDTEKIKVVERFSKEYFDLTRKNTIEENQVFASQRKGEELLINLRGQVYRIR